MDLLRLAWRNLGRNRRRTVITATALVIGVALSVASYAYFDGMTAEMLRALTRYDLGHAQLHNPEFPELEDFGEMALVGDNGASFYSRVDWFTPEGLRSWGDGTGSDRCFDKTDTALAPSNGFTPVTR